MPSWSLCTAFASLVAITEAQPQCFEAYECIFHHNIGGTKYSWDLHQLCRPPGSEYAFNDSAQLEAYSFNICGNTSAVCAPGYDEYVTQGSAVQITGDWNQQVDCSVLVSAVVVVCNYLPSCFAAIVSALYAREPTHLVRCLCMRYSESLHRTGAGN
jgi:hypothetical protein